MNPRFLPSTLALAAVLIAFGPGPAASAGIITSNPNLPPSSGYYDSPPTFGQYNGGGGLTIVLTGITLTQVFGSFSPAGPDEIENFTFFINGNVSYNGAPAQATTGSGPSQTRTFGKNGFVTGTFNAEMLQFDMSAVSGFGAFTMRESPTNQSLGQTVITPVGGGNYQIDSFFDVFTELSIDGGATWIPNANGPSHINLVPEPGTTLLLGLGLGGMLLRRRRTA